jgi:hypothetical protein
MNILGNVRWNVAFGILAMIVTFVSSYGNNLFFTAFLRSLLAFVFFFIVAHIFRVFLSFVLSIDQPSEKTDSFVGDNRESKGANVDWVTPEDDTDLLKSIEQGAHRETNEFQSMDPSQLAKALRTLTDK